MGIPAKPATPVLNNNDTGTNSRCFFPITEAALPTTELVSSVASGIGVGGGTNPVITTGTFGGTAATKLATFAASGQCVKFVGRGISIRPTSGAYCINSWVGFNLAAYQSGANQLFLDFTGVIDVALGIRGSGNNDLVVFGNGSNATGPLTGFVPQLNHDYLLYWGYTFDGSNACAYFVSVYDFTASAYVAITGAGYTQVGSTNIYTHTGAAGTNNQIDTGATLPCDASIGGAIGGPTFTLSGVIYGGDFLQSTSIANIWTQTQITELVADPMRSARAATPSITFSGATTSTCGTPSATVTVTLSAAVGGSGTTLALGSANGGIFSPTSLVFSATDTVKTFTINESVSGNDIITVSGTGVTTNTLAFTANPAAPTAVTATPGNAKITVSWTTGTGSTSDNIYASTSSGTETLLASGVVSPYADSILTLGTHKYYYVKSAGNNATLSAASAEVNATVTTYSVVSAVFDISLGSGNAGLTLNAQLYTSSFVATGSPITTGFHEVASNPGFSTLPGTYWLSTNIVSGFQGFIVYYPAGSPSNELGFGAINSGSTGGGGGGSGGGIITF